MRSSWIEHRGPSSGLLAYALGRGFLTVAGWRIEGTLPHSPKGVMIAAPHTSGWDLPYMLATAWVFRLKLNWLGKHTLFKGVGAALRWTGGIPVDRRARHGAVHQVVQHFEQSEGIFLAISPAGTRSRSNCWKSGFYHIANDARVPIICGFLDYRRKVAGVGPSFVPTGDVKADMDRIREFYRGIVGHRDEQTSSIRLREEEQADETATAAQIPVAAE